MTLQGPALRRRTLLAGALAMPGLASRALAQTGAAPIRMGIINDQSGPYADIAGPGSAQALRMAVADFGGSVLGRPIEILVGDHQNRPDIGLALIREWYGPGNVDVILDFANSAISLAAQPIARQADRIAIHVASTSADISGKGCSPNGFQWAQTTHAAATAPIGALLKAGKRTFYFVTVDYTFGAALERDATSAITAGGGRVLGSVRHPLNTTDFGSYLVQASSSGADVVILASTGNDMATAVKQAAEFGITRRQSVVPLICYLSDIHAIGLEAAQGLEFVQSWYWDLTDASRAWARRFEAQRHRMPNDVQAGVYSAALHYLGAVRAAGTAGTGPVLAAMHAMPVHDMFAPDGHVQANGQMVFDLHMMRVKSPAQSRGPWDYLEQVAVIPAVEAFRSAAQSGCPLAAAG